MTMGTNTAGHPPATGRCSVHKLAAFAISTLTTIALLALLVLAVGADGAGPI